MSGPQPIADMLAPVERGMLCDCGVLFTQHGIAGEKGTGGLWIPSHCPACTERQERERADQLRTEEAERSRAALDRRRRLVLLRIKELEVPPLYTDASLENFTLHGTREDQNTQSRALTFARRYCDEWPDVRHDILVFQGGYGTGKGHIAWGMVKWLVETHAIRARVVKLADLVRRLRAAWKRDALESEDDALRFFRELDLLVIDEVSRHAFYGEQIHQHLYDVLDARNDQQRPTVITTNEDDAGLDHVLRGALMDRIIGNGGCVSFGQASYRRKLAADRAGQ